MTEGSEFLLNIARHKVACGVKWLDKQAQTDPRFRGWRLEMMSIYKGKIYSHVNMNRGTDEPLALVFKWCPEFADQSDGRVKGYIVREKLGISDEKAKIRGFFEGVGIVALGSDELEKHVWIEALNRAWREALGEHITHTAPRISQERIKEVRPRGWLRRLVGSRA